MSGLRNKITFGLTEAVLTLAGIVTVVMPLVLWAVPQHHDFSIIVFFFVLSVGGGAFVLFIGVSYLQRRLFDRRPTGRSDEEQIRPEQRLVDWEREQEEKLEVVRSQYRLTGSAMGNMRYVSKIAGFLALAFALIFLAGWLVIALRYG